MESPNAAIRERTRGTPLLQSLLYVPYSLLQLGFVALVLLLLFAMDGTKGGGEWFPLSKPLITMIEGWLLSVPSEWYERTGGQSLLTIIVGGGFLFLFLLVSKLIIVFVWAIIQSSSSKQTFSAGYFFRWALEVFIAVPRLWLLLVNRWLVWSVKKWFISMPLALIVPLVLLWIGGVITGIVLNVRGAEGAMGELIGALIGGPLFLLLIFGTSTITFGRRWGNQYGSGYKGANFSGCLTIPVIIIFFVWAWLVFLALLLLLHAPLLIVPVGVLWGGWEDIHRNYYETPFGAFADWFSVYLPWIASVIVIIAAWITPVWVEKKYEKLA